MSAENYIVKVNEFITPFLSKNGFTLIKTEFVSEDNNWYLRLFMDLSEAEFEKRKAEMEAAAAENAAEAEPESEDEENMEPELPGVSINDCVKVSRYLSKWLDKADFIKETYTMEVCSKGFLESEQTEAETQEGETK